MIKVLLIMKKDIPVNSLIKMRIIRFVSESPAQAAVIILNFASLAERVFVRDMDGHLICNNYSEFVTWCNNILPASESALKYELELFRNYENKYHEQSKITKEPVHTPVQ